jgi:hypothetical protein
MGGSSLPHWKLEIIHDSPCWSIDWQDFFRTGVRTWAIYQNGEMRGFHVIFHVRMAASRHLIVWDDDGSIVHRRGEIIHEDRSAHALSRHEIEVKAGGVLEIAQRQLGWGWCGRIEPYNQSASGLKDEFLKLLRSSNSSCKHRSTLR